MSGKLYIVATPIGNLKDFSFRAIETLNECDIILCEDVLHSLKLLNNYEIKKKYFVDITLDNHNNDFCHNFRLWRN